MTADRRSDVFLRGVFFVLIIGQDVFEAGEGARVLAWALADWCECCGRGYNGGSVPNGDPFRRSGRRSYPRYIRCVGHDPAPGPGVSATCATPTVGPEGLLPVPGCVGGVIWYGLGEERPSPPGKRRLFRLRRCGCGTGPGCMGKGGPDRDAVANKTCSREVRASHGHRSFFIRGGRSHEGVPFLD